MLIVSAAAVAGAQQAADVRAPLAEQAIALDVDGREALAARLRTTELNGSVDSPVTNVRFTVENHSQYDFTYVSGWVTFYDQGDVRCGEGLFKVDAFAKGEAVETDAPGLRLTCSPYKWRLKASSLIAPGRDAAVTPQSEVAPSATESTGRSQVIPPLEINIDGQTFPIQLGNPIEINTSKRKSVRIVVSARP